MNPLAKEEAIKELAAHINEEHNRWMEDNNFHFPDFALLIAERFLNCVDVKVNQKMNEDIPS